MNSTEVAKLVRYEKSALWVANQVRTRFGLKRKRKLQPGIPAEPYSCPIAATILVDAGDTFRSVRVGTQYITVITKDGEIPHHHVMSGSAAHFVKEFDSHHYPELIVKEGKF